MNGSVVTTTNVVFVLVTNSSANNSKVCPCRLCNIHGLTMLAHIHCRNGFDFQLQRSKADTSVISQQAEELG